MGVCLGVLGASCLLGGLLLLGWRLLAPEDAVILPPNFSGTPPPTPTPGILGTPLPPPPLPSLPASLALLPISEPLSPSPTHWAHSQTLPATPSPRPTSVTPTVTPVAPPGAQSPTPTLTATITAPHTVTPTVTVALPTAPPTPIAVPIGVPPVRIRIPDIGVDHPVVLGDDWETLKRGVGHRVGSANPGQRGNMVMSAHNDIYGEIFRNLPDVQLGDVIEVYTASQMFRYVVTQQRIIQPTEVSVMYPTSTPVLTLISCYPYGIDSHRIVVIAELQP